MKRKKQNLPLGNFDFLKIDIFDHPLRKENYQLRYAYLLTLYDSVINLVDNKPIFLEYFNVYLLSFKISDAHIEKIMNESRSKSEYLKNLRHSTRNQWHWPGLLKLPRENYKYALWADALFILFFCKDILFEQEIMDLGQEIGINSLQISIINSFCSNLYKDAIDTAEIDFQNACYYDKQAKHIRFLLRRVASKIENNKRKNFKVAVVATMSAGKTTFINYLVGYNLLPFSNQACTSKTTSITDNDFLNHIIGRYTLNNGQIEYAGVINEDRATQWNQNQDIVSVDIECDILGIKNDKMAIVLYDTPGTNYSLDQHHGEITYDLLDNIELELILYLINATNILTDDDAFLLNKVLLTLHDNPRTRVLFLLNKVDEFDTEGDDNISDTITNASADLERLGYSHPNIIPVSAYAAKLFRMALKERELTKKEMSDFELFFKLFSQEAYDLTQYALMDYEVTKPNQDKNFNVLINNREYKSEKIAEVLWRTGLPLIETYLDYLV